MLDKPISALIYLNNLESFVTNMSDAQKIDMSFDFDNIVKAICYGLNEHNPEGLTLNADTDMTKDLSLDSVAIMDLMFVLEEHFDISIPLNKLVDVLTIGDLAKLIQNLEV